MNIYPLYSCTSFNQFITSHLYWIQQHMSNNTTPMPSIATTSNSGEEMSNAIDQYQNEIDHLFCECNTINIVLESIRNAFTIYENNTTEEYLDQVDRELSIAYDDLMAQVKHLERRLKRMTNEINQKFIVAHQQWDRRPTTPTPTTAENMYNVNSN